MLGFHMFVDERRLMQAQLIWAVALMSLIVLTVIGCQGEPDIPDQAVIADNGVMTDYLDAARRAGQRKSPPDTDLDSLAYNMAVITGNGTPNPANFERFRFLVPRFTELCSDLSTDLEVANLAVAAQMVMEEGGLTENLREVAENVHWVVTSLYARSPSLMQMKDVCREIFTLYATGRQGGLSAAEAREFLFGVIEGLAFPR